MDEMRARGDHGPVPTWLEIQGLSEESLRAAVMGLGIEILGALCAQAEPPTVRVRLCSLSARKFTYTMYVELCRYMESCRAGRGSERVVVPGYGKDTELTGGPGGVVRIKVEDEHLGLEGDQRNTENGKWRKNVTKFSCTSCSHTFNAKAALMRHRKRHRPVSSDKTKKCSNYSSRTCYKSKLVNHTETNATERIFTCSVCGEGMKRLRDLNVHMLIHTGERPYSCKVCGKMFSSPSDLRKHFRSIHPEESYTCSTICSMCGQRMGNLCKWKIHMRIHTGERPYACKFCPKAYPSLYNLKIHTFTHTGEHPYICEVCGKKYSYSFGLKKHARIHTIKLLKSANGGNNQREKSYKCSVCNRVFSRSAGLAQHIRVHTREKFYKCYVCSTAFAHSVNLAKHNKIHNGEKPFQCSVCSKVFARSVHLSQHKKIHTGEKNQQEKPYNCWLCSKAFAYFGNFSKHYKIHPGEKPSQCSVCSKVVFGLSQLIEHNKTHHGDQTGQTGGKARSNQFKRPYKCSVCFKTFTDSSTFHKHEMIHAVNNYQRENYPYSAFS